MMLVGLGATYKESQKAMIVFLILMVISNIVEMLFYIDYFKIATILPKPKHKITLVNMKPIESQANGQTILQNTGKSSLITNPAAHPLLSAGARSVMVHSQSHPLKTESLHIVNHGINPLQTHGIANNSQIVKNDTHNELHTAQVNTDQNKSSPSSLSQTITNLLSAQKMEHQTPVSTYVI